MEFSELFNWGKSLNIKHIKIWHKIMVIPLQSLKRKSSSSIVFLVLQPLKWLKSKSTQDQVGGRDTYTSHRLLSEQTQLVIPIEQKMPKILWETYIYQVGQDNMLYGPIHSMYLHSLNIESKLEYGRHQTLWYSQKFEYWSKGRKLKQCIAMSVFLRRLNGVTEKLDCPWLLGRWDCIIGAKRCQESLLEVGEERIQGNFFLSSKQVHNRYVYISDMVNTEAASRCQKLLFSLSKARLRESENKCNKCKKFPPYYYYNLNTRKS